MVTSICYKHLGQPEVAEQEFKSGIEQAESIGERRLRSLLAGHFATHLADLGRLDEAFETARANLDYAEELGLLYSRTEARRCLAHVQLRRGELDEALSLCEDVLEMLGEGKSPVSRLWLEPLYIEALHTAGRGKDARQRLDAYEELLTECQSPRFDREAATLETLLAGD